MTYPPQQPGPYGQQPSGPPYGQPGQQYGHPYGAPQQPLGNQPYGGGYPGPYGPPPPGSPKPKRTSLIVGIVITVLVVLGLAGGGFLLQGGKDKSSGGGQDKVTGKPTSISFSNVDPCGYLAPDAFKDVAGTDPTTKQLAVKLLPNGLNSCSVNVVLKIDNTAGILMTMDSSLQVPLDKVKAQAQQGTTGSQVGSFYVVKPTDTGTQTCTETVYRPDGSGISVDGNVSLGAVDASGKPKPGVNTCAVVDKAVTGIETTLTGKGPTKISYPQTSFGSVDLCKSVNPVDAASILNNQGIAPQASSTTHKCSYLNPSNPQAPSVQLSVALEAQPQGAQQYPGAQEVNIAGRDTIVYSFDAPGSPISTCTALTPGKVWQPWQGTVAPNGAAPKLIEYAQLQILTFSGGLTQQSCQQAQALAAKVWPNLPQGG